MLPSSYGHFNALADCDWLDRLISLIRCHQSLAVGVVQHAPDLGVLASTSEALWHSFYISKSA